jgi:hypothetical protein
VYAQQYWHNDGTASVSMLEIKREMEHSASNKKVTAQQDLPSPRSPTHTAFRVNTLPSNRLRVNATAIPI